MFRDDQQLARCCAVLCARAKVPDAWNASGPTAVAFAVRDGHSPLSTGQQVVILACWSLWNGEGDLTFARLLDVLERDQLGPLLALVLAAKTSSDAVDVWLYDHTPRPRPSA